jgi:hypothetical protein
MLENNQLPAVSKLMTLKGIICFFSESANRWQHKTSSSRLLKRQDWRLAFGSGLARLSPGMRAVVNDILVCFVIAFRK